ncbi:unnamed protein product [Rotaria magnacalcarata]|uniref:C2H2-type domain-containing protein n=1 Tax=Rotaria magnacalcarata TaxID=392030 RepID=A0A816Y0X1_9BILA|nr:unnamed protein product [Rotaria magnacalcarata]CAF2154024.1 unnamed protein product [Rotaria magnacalcarata]CAF3924978.1 unnamed protein product [Rotaria magnacalcarata]CAF3948490.1 unnamed protein product [Rotaria magnacalcarata]
MYIFNTKTSRCSLCYALLSTNTNPTSSTVTYSSSSLNRRYATRCSISSIERLISSSIKFERLWRKNENGVINNRSICFRCCGTIRQIEQIQNDIEQLNNDKKLLMNKIKHNLSKRAHILQGQRHQNNNFLTNHQTSPLYEDDDTEEGEEKPRTVITTNGNGHSSPLIIPPTTTLVGAKRRKCNIAHKINLENKPIESPLLSFNHLKQSNTAIAQPTTKFPSPNLFFDSQSSKYHRSRLFSSGINGHDLANLSFGSSYKPLALANTSSSSSPPPPTTTPQFLDPATGALIAIVSNPHHAALLAQQHQQILKSSSSISPSSIVSIDDHEIISTKPTPLPKKFPCLLCGRDFSNKSNLNRHHSIVHVALRNFECIRCPKKFKLRQGLKTHMQRCHGVNADEPTFVLQKHRLHNHHHHPSLSSSSQVIAQTNK